MLKPSILIAFWIGCTLNLVAQVPQNPCSPSGLQPVIVYSIRGGLTGSSREWSVFNDGKVCSGDRVVGRLSTDSVRRLLDQISAKGFFNLKSDYKDAGGSCYQCAYYKITVQNGAKPKTVETRDGARNVPPSLWEINSSIQHELKAVR